MKALKLFLILLPFLIPVLTLADVAPNPIQIKSIVPSYPVSIQMVSEIVKVELAMDSSFVECTFHMHNTGKAQNLEIGFPIMNFYLWNFNNQPQQSDKDRFEVYVNGQSLSKISIYIPNHLKRIYDSISVNKGYDVLRDYENQNKPWYLWRSHFNKNESQVIIVKYALPSGATKMNRFFNYLLSTGAGWHGNIEHAQVVVNLKNIPADQILDISPKNYQKSGNIISWDFKSLKPTKSDDILINYEQVKGSYATAIKKLDSTAYFLNDKKMDHHVFAKINPNDIESIQVIKTHPYEKNGAILIYTKQYALENLKRKIEPVNEIVWKQISAMQPDTILKNYHLIINGKIYTWRNTFGTKSFTDSIAVLKVVFKRISRNKGDILITAK